MNLNRIEKILSAREKKFIGTNLNYKKFLILGAARSATTFLVENLNFNPACLCFTEILKEKHLEILFNDVFIEKKYYNTICQLRQKNPIIFVNDFIFGPYNPIYQAIGFKLLYYHLDSKNIFPLKKYFIENNDIAIIEIERENLLKSFTSMKLASANNLWHTTDKNFIQTSTVNIDLFEASSYFKYVLDKRKEFNSIFQQNSKIKIKYNDLINDTENTMNKIQYFLNIPEIKTKTNLIKMEHRKIFQVIENYEEIYNGLKNTEWESFLDDSFD